MNQGRRRDVIQRVIVILHHIHHDPPHPPHLLRLSLSSGVNRQPETFLLVAVVRDLWGRRKAPDWRVTDETTFLDITLKPQERTMGFRTIHENNRRGFRK